MIMMLQTIAQELRAEIEHDHEMAVLAQDTELEKVVEHLERNEKK